MKEQRYFKIAGFLFVLAALLSGYLVYDHYQLINGENFKSFCNISSYLNCDAVNASEYSVFLRVPFATWGLVYYIFAAVVAFIAAASPFYLREASLLLIPASAFSVVLSIVLALISVTKINAICIFCSTLHVLNVVTAGLIFMGSKGVLKAPAAELKKADRSKLFGFTIFGAVTFVILAVATSQMKKSYPFSASDFHASFVEKPKVNVDAGNSPRVGSASPKITLIEFSDFQCPFCGRQSKELGRILKLHHSKVQLVFKNFPLDSTCNPKLTVQLHANACSAARAAWCANEQGKFEPYHVQLFSRQKELTIENYKKWASEAGMDVAAFDACLNSDTAKAAVSADIKQAIDLNVGSTPTFFVNGRRIEGMVTLEMVEYLLRNQELLQ